MCLRPHSAWWTRLNSTRWYELLFLRVVALTGDRAQMNTVAGLLRESGLIPPNLVDAEVDWFFETLQIQPSYFLRATPEVRRPAQREG